MLKLIHTHTHIYIYICKNKLTWVLATAVNAVVSVDVVELPSCISIKSAEMEANNDISVLIRNSYMSVGYYWVIY